MTSTLSEAELVKVVQDAYGAKALTAKLDDGDRKPSLAIKIFVCSKLTLIRSFIDTTKVAASFGYTPAEILAIPSEANLGLSCGNPVGAASLKEVGKSSDNIRSGPK